MARLLVFSTEDCVACDVVKPIVKREAQRAKMLLEEHDPVEEPALAQRFDIQVVPTLVLLNNDEFIGELHGMFNEKDVRRLMSCATA